MAEHLPKVQRQVLLIIIKKQHSHNFAAEEISIFFLPRNHQASWTFVRA